jgi:hypothetical protein
VSAWRFEQPCEPRVTYDRITPIPGRKWAGDNAWCFTAHCPALAANGRRPRICAAWRTKGRLQPRRSRDVGRCAHVRAHCGRTLCHRRHVVNGFQIDADAVAGIARNLFGEPNKALSSRRELRFGRRGSLAVVPNRGVFHDHESGVSGGVLDLLVYAGAARDRAEAARLLESDGELPTRETPKAMADRNLADAKVAAARIANAGALWKPGKPIVGTVAEIYLRHARAISAPLEAAALRFLADAPFTPYAPDHRRHPAMIAAVVNGAGRFIGAHVTYLRCDGSAKADVLPARKIVGLAGGGRIPLIPGTRLVVAEGIESALSAWDAAVRSAGMSSDYLGATAALSAGGVASLQWPPATTAILIAPDRDASGAGERAALSLAHRAHAAGLGVAFLRPPAGISDWNDAAQAERVRL